MDWLADLAEMEEYYTWKQENLPAYPDLMLEYGLFRRLLGELKTEAGGTPGSPDTPGTPNTTDAASDLAAAADMLRRLDEDRCEFHDYRAWTDWQAEQHPDGGESLPSPSGAELAARLRGGELGSAGLTDELLTRIGDLDACPGALRRAALCPAFRRLFASMAEVWAHRAEREQAELFHAWAVLSGGNPARHWAYRAQLARVFGDTDSVAGILDEGLGLYPDDIELLRERSEEADRMGEREGAVEFMQRAVELRPGWPDLRYELARLHKENENPEASLVQFDKALEINPGYVKAAVSQAEMLLEIGQTEEAEKKLLDLKERDIESRDVYRLLSRVYAERKDPRRAERYGVLGQEPGD